MVCFIAALVFVCLSVLLPCGHLYAFDFSGWNNGSNGYNSALELVKEEESPLILYFHTDWCKWSKKMNNNFLASYDVDSFLSDIEKVEVDPDKNSAGKWIEKKFSVRGYPTFLVTIPAITQKTIRVYPFKKSRDMTTSDFIAAVRMAIAQLYNEKAFNCFKRRAYDDAIDYSEAAIAYHPESDYAYYIAGCAYHSMGVETRDVELIESAALNIEKAVDLEPNRSEYAAALAKVKKTLEKFE